MIKKAPRFTKLTRADYFKLHGEPSGATRETMFANADVLLSRVNGILLLFWDDGGDIGIDQISNTPIASGRRSPGANARTANAAAASTHLTCQGIDIQDTIDREFAAWCICNLPALEKAGLWMEDPRWTGGRTNTDPWVHLQSRGPRSGRRVYVPSRKPPTAPTFYADRGITTGFA